MEYTKHSVSKENVSVLSREADWSRRGISKAIHIQQEDPTLNRGRERHNLLPIYQEVIPATSHDPVVVFNSVDISVAEAQLIAKDKKNATNK